MKNINRDYLVTVNAKTAKIEPPKDMKFFITDVLTCNIFFQLVFNEYANNSITDYIDYMPSENASDYTLTLRVVNPNKEHKEIVAELLEQDKNFFVADLPKGFTDVLGTYKCELFIDTTINGREERNTTDSFEYKVEKSIFSDLDPIIEKDPDYPLLMDTLATKDYVHYAMENMDLFGYATRDYVNQVVIGGDIDLSDYVTEQELENALSNFSGGNIDLSDYVTDEELAEALINFSGGDIDLSEYVTDQELAQALIDFAGSGNIDLSSYVTHRDLNDALENKADSSHTHDEYITDLSDYATKDEIPASLPADGGNSNTVGGYSIWVGTLDEYYSLESITADMLYFIKEDE